MNPSFAPLLGVMKFEVEPISFGQYGQSFFLFPGGRLLEMALLWAQDAGGFAMAGLVFWLINGLLNPVYDTVDGKKKNRLVTPWMLGLSGMASVFYLVALGLVVILSKKTQAELAVDRIGRRGSILEWSYEYSLAFAGLLAMLAFAGPFFADLLRIRYGRIYAIAKLSYKEAVRRRIVWVFLSILILYLFPANWFFREKPEDELKSIIDVTTRGMNVLLISVGLLLTAFSIPTDIKSLTIHTIVTKPVERFEIVLGRFLGYLGLITIAMFVMTGLGLLLINSGNVSEEAAEESMKSRVAVYGDLAFNSRNKTAEFSGIDVGREDVYRKYIAGASPHQAVWGFDRFPGAANLNAPVMLEFAFDVYRTTKGEEGRGVTVSFDILTHRWDPSKNDEFQEKIRGLGNVKPSDENWNKIDQIAEEYGRYILKSWQIFDYHTSAIPVPAGLFKNSAGGELVAKTVYNPEFQVPGRPLRRLQVTLRCDTPAQFVGAAKHDLYFLESEGNFSLNYFKGSVGLWFRLVIASAIAVTCSTYLSGVLSFLVALCLYLCGYFIEFINELGNGTNVGGGPMESFARLVKNNVAAAEMDATPTIRALQAFDGLFRWVIRRVLNVIPDVERYGLTDYVAQGFNIAPDFLLLNFLMMMGYVLPWMVAAYYLMKAREIAA